MKKHIILSGPPASGKTTIANAIALPHDCVLRVEADEVDEILNTKGFSRGFFNPFSLVIIEGCTIDQILKINKVLGNIGLTDFKEKCFTIVYTTLESTSPEVVGADLKLISLYPTITNDNDCEHKWKRYAVLKEGSPLMNSCLNCGAKQTVVDILKTVLDSHGYKRSVTENF